MAPRSSPEQAPEEPEPAVDQETFERTLRGFAANRGIGVDFNIRVASKHIDLHRLYTLVTSRGGYDRVSAEKLAWRKIGLDCELGSTNAATYAFALKTAYYKNLAAFEIKYLHGRDPPPVEILEALTAKGGDILSRNVETFKSSSLQSSMANGESDSEDELARTPKEEKMEVDDPPGSSGRASRGLRQQPPQRVLYQPDISSSRNLRQSSGNTQSPQPMQGQIASNNLNHPNSSFPNNSFSLANYEPRPPMPMTLRPVTTPGNNYPAFKANVQRLKDARRSSLGLAASSTQGNMKPGAGFDGPNIYIRILQGLRCPLKDEQDYALHHLVKISHERGDKYKFEAFPGLAEGLVEYLLKVGSLFYDVDWEVSYTEEIMDIGTLDAVNGTPDILQRIQSLKPIYQSDSLESPSFQREITKISEAGLTVRNLALLEENCIYLSNMPQLRDFLTIALNLPDLPQITELKHYALDIVEHVIKYWRMSSDDSLYISLLGIIDDGRDRGAILTALRAVCRISLVLDDQNLLEDVPISVIRHVFDWSVLEDEELVSACLDFFYQFTANVENVNFLLMHADDLSLAPFLHQLTRLLQHRAATNTIKSTLFKAVPPAPATDIPSVPPDLMDQFLKHDEPERSNHWLRTVFEEDPESNITQIALWQAYQNRFSEFATTQMSLLPAAEFIKNVSTIFQGAKAEVVNGPHPRFIIKGIRPRHAPVDSKGQLYPRCQWMLSDSQQCQEYRLKSEQMFEHIVQAHLGLKRKSDGTWDLQAVGNGAQVAPRDCKWANCAHFSRHGGRLAFPTQLAVHVRTHLADSSRKSSLHQRYNLTSANQENLNHPSSLDGKLLDFDPVHGKEAAHKYLIYHNTMIDDLSNPTGHPSLCIMILRNLARNIPRAVALNGKADEEQARRQAVETLLVPLKDRLTYVMAHNRALMRQVAELMQLMDKGLA